MPTSPGVSRKYPQCYPAPRKYGLVIGCVDCRLLDDLVRFLDHDNLTNRYYQATFAGCAIGVCSEPPKPGARNKSSKPPGFAKWRGTLVDHLKLVLKLTKGELTDVYIIEHTDCGAYRLFLDRDYYADPSNPDTAGERADHAHYARVLAEDLAGWFESDDAKELEAEIQETNKAFKLVPPLVRGFLMDLRGGVDLMFGTNPDETGECYQ